MYHLLPSMNCLFDSTELLFSMMSEYDLHYKDKLNFRIIDTIIYKSGVPISYYYMSDGKILCKNNYKDIQTNLIMTKCINNKHIKTDICALFLNQEIKLKFHDEETNQQVKEIQNITVEHCTSHNLNYYLIHKQKQSTLFQHFVYPIDNKNFIIEVEWNNQIIQLSKRTNLYQLDDRMEQYKKLLTFEKNCDQHVFANNVSHERIVKHISEVCKIIKKRVNTINHYKYILTNFGEHRTKERKFIEEAEKKEILKSMILHFKIDEDCNIYLLYCVNMEFKESYFKSTGKEKLVFAVHFKVPDEIMCEKVPLDQAKKHNFSKKAELEGRILCLNCNRFVRKVNMYKIKYDFIIRNNDRKYGPNSVPIIFRRINNNKLKDEMYFKFKNYPDFLDHDADLCDECYIEHTEFIKTKIKIDNNYKVNKCPIVKEEIVIESDKFIDIKDRKEFLKCQIQLTEKNPDFQKKFNNNEKKSQDKNVKFTKLVDLNYEKTKNFSLESLQKKLAKSLKINSDLNSKDDKEIFIDNLLRSKSKIDAMQKESQFGFCKNLLKYYDKKEVSNSIKKMKYLDLVKNFDTDFLIQTDLGSKAANDHNEIKKLPDSLNKIMKVEKVDVNPKGRNYFSQLDHFRSHNQSPATTIFSKDNNKIPTHNDFLHYKSFRIKNEQLKKDNINEEIANNVKYLDIENKTFHKRINSTILSHKTDNYIFTKPNTPLITAIEGVSKIKEIVKNKGKGELIISHKKSKTVNTGSNESTKDILDNYSNLTKYSSLIEGLKKSLNSRKKTIK